MNDRWYHKPPPIWLMKTVLAIQLVALVVVLTVGLTKVLG